MSERLNDENVFEEVTLIDENGEEVAFDHVMTFLYEGNRYIALLPLDDCGLDDDEVLIMKIENDGKEDKYVSIDNDILLNEVFDEFLSLMEELDEDDEDDQDE